MNLTKLILNNTIVELRQPVRQSRVHCINRFTREAKKLKECKGSDKQKEKNVKKAERYIEQVLIMKKLNDDEITKFALLNERSLVDITNDVTASLEDKALAHLVHRKAVSTRIQSFREKYPEWKQCLPFLLETLGEKYKFKKQSKMSKKKKQKSPNKKDRNSNYANIVEVLHKGSGIWTVKPMKHSSEEAPKHDERNEDEKELKTRHSKTIWSKNELEERKIKESNEYPERNSDDSKTCDKMETETAEAIVEEKPVEGAVDSFFLTKDNAEYISISAKENVDKPDNPVRKTFNRDFYPPKEREFNRSKDAIKWKNNKVLKSKNSFARFPNAQNEEIPPVKPVHPSWEAKKKLTQVVPFQGKKIKFEDG